MKKFVAYYSQMTKKGVKEKTMEVKAMSKAHAWCMVSEMLPRHSHIGNIYIKNGKNHKLVKAGLL